ncbi:MAG: hypothetical protein JXA67_11150 [Micromonosporaceae bacterium]|nr:hypothetical protein [Micromonosporaceae bacterium]
MNADPVNLLNQLGAQWSPDMGAYLAGDIELADMRCALCGGKPCQCPPFGTSEYFALIDRVHGRKR